MSNDMEHKTDTDSERASFEAWHISKFGRAFTKWDEDRGRYAWDLTQELWGGWQARASLAASAGSEPNAPIGWRKIFNDTRNGLFESPPSAYDCSAYREFADRALDAVEEALAELPTHPSPPEGMVGGWISVDARLPQPGMPVLLDIDRKFPIRAMWAPAKTLVASGDSDVVGDYDEAKDIYYCPEGWYEWNQFEETHWFVTETPRAWQALPITAPPIAAGGGKDADHG